jgi:NADH-quinone oxidoreductase subunit L
MANWLIALVIGIPWLGALCVWLSAWLSERRTGDPRPRIQHTLAISFAVAGGAAALALIFFASDTVAVRWSLGGVFGDITFVPDGLGVLLAAIASIIGCLTIIFSVDYMHGERALGRYYAVILLFIGAMAGLVLTNSLLMLFLFWEIVAICSYALISFRNDDPKAVAGGIKALVITQIGGLGLLVGVLAIYAHQGSYQIADFIAKANTLPPAALSLIAFGFLAAAAAKSAQVPFHSWLTGAMEAPTPVSALIHAATMVNAGVYLLARFYPAFAEVPGWREAVITVGVISAVAAALMALVANDLKRVLAYSTISQLGYMVYAVGTGAIFASQFHLLSHAVFKALLFLSAGAVIHAVGTRDMRQMGGLGQKLPFVRGMFVIGALALAGVPVFNGFWSKDLILEAGMTDGPWWPYQLMLGGVLLTALYTIRMVWLVFYGEPRMTEPAKQIHDAPFAMRAALIPLALGTLTTWLLVAPLNDLFQITLPLHSFHHEVSVQSLISAESLPVIGLALTMTVLGAVIWLVRRGWLGWLVNMLQAPGRFAAADFGFEWLNRQVVAGIQRSAALLQKTQTGQLNWNVAGIALGLLALLAAFAVFGGIR